MKKIFTSIIALSVSAITFAQTPTHRECGTLSHHEYLKQTRPNYENDLTAYNQMIDQYLANQALNSSAQRSSAAIVTIPVVVHVVYNTAAENISDAQAASQVQVLNDDFAKLNTDANKVTQPTFSTVAAGANIRFCLAQRDPNGNPTTGIVHKSTTATSFGTNDAVKSNATAGDNPWDVTKYVNIWVCDLSGSLLGYGEFPTGSISNTWGLVIDYAYTGKGGSATPPFNLGRTGTHEFGHCFNLYHIWGDDGTGCSGSDQCADTPNQAGEHYGCFTQGSIQTDACSPSSPGTMWMNYMDYTDDACMYMFTQQQVARMEAVVNTAPWNILQSSNACTPPTSLDASIANIIDPANGLSTCTNSVTPKVTVANTGSVTLTSVKVLYKMDATATQTLNWTGTLASGASTVVTLNAYTGLTTAAHTFSVWTTAPNGGTDQNATNDSKTSTFTVTSGAAVTGLPFTEGFESGATPPAGWTIVKANTIDATVSWSVVSNSTGLTAGSTKAARMDNYSSNSDIHGQLDALKSPAISFSAATTSSVSLSFDVSYRRYATSGYDDTLNVYVSTNCGGTWTKLYGKGGTALATAVGTQTTAYTPTVSTQWRRETVSLASYAGVPSAIFKFESRSGYGNNVYLDNINITYTTTAAAPVANFSMAPTPACTGSAVQLTDLSTNTPTTWTWTATSSTGVTFSNANVKNPTVTFANAGTYTIGLSAANASGTGTTTKTITVNATPTVAVSNASVCIGSATTLLAAGATSYSWNTGATTSSISVTPTVNTNYTVTGTSAGCSNTKTVSVTVIANPTVAVSNATICSGNAANLTASGATSYLWNTGATTSTVSVSPASTTNYTVTGTTNGCSNTKTVSVTVKATPTVAVNSMTICSGNNAALVSSGATTYSWNTGATTSSISVSPTSTTNYTVTGTTNGCSNSKVASVTVNTTPTVAVANATICSGNSANLTASGATSYSWNTGATTSSISVSPTVNTNYTVTGTNIGCSNTKTVSVTVKATPTVAVNNATICSGNNAVLTASGATSYSWNTGATTSSVSVSPTSTTNYTVTGTTNGCSNTNVGNVTVNATPTVAVANATICAGGTANLNASGATTYSWNTGASTSSISVSPGITTNYTVTGTTAGCSNSKTVSVTVASTPTVAVANATICSGNNTNLTASGAATYSWNTGATSASILVSPTSSTNYTVTGYNGTCSNTKVVSVTVNASPTVAVTSGTICVGGSANLSASGATTYSWNTGATSSSITVSPTTTTNYTVTGTTGSCSTKKVATVTVNNLPNVTVASATICSGATATLTASGASIYSWNTGSTSSSITDNPAVNTTYTVTGTSAAGCVKSVTASITVGSAPAIVVNSESICAGSSATLTASGVSTYTWDSGSNAASIVVNPSATTVYTVSGELVGCGSTAVSTTTVTVNSNPTVTMGSIVGPFCINSPTVALTGSPAGGTFSGAGVSGSSFDPSVSGAGTFTLTYDYTDANSCSGSDNQSVMVSLCTGIDELSSGSVSIYPNPTRDVINVSIDQFNSENTRIELFDAIGKLIISEKVNNTITSIDLTHLSNGIYTIRIVVDGQQMVKRIVKEY